MKYSHPKVQAQRALLRRKLETYEQLIQEDIEELKKAARPLEIAKNVIHQAADTFRDNSLTTQGMRLALTMLPRATRHPILGIAAQIAVPLLVRNLPGMLNFVARKTEEFKETSLGEKLGNVWERLRWRVAQRFA
ncbi:MAG: hypothetical protein ACKVUS_07010 [Saprospiraceae bacterium]